MKNKPEANSGIEKITMTTVQLTFLSNEKRYLSMSLTRTFILKNLKEQRLTYAICCQNNSTPRFGGGGGGGVMVVDR